MVGLGIDTGGTYTDGVLIDLRTGEVLGKAKAPTTHGNLVDGIAQALAGLDAARFPSVRLVGLSTTLATNSIVEGKGWRVGLIVAVPRPETFTPPARLPVEGLEIIAGAHDRNGGVAADLDEDAAARAVARLAGRVDAFAVSSYFSIYNPGHELRLRELILASCDVPVVCGHELSGDVGLLERSVTAALNARLLPVVRELLEAVRAVLNKRGISAPLMVVKGDGTLLSERAAALAPVETVLSGPAASVVGACRLSGLREALVVDMGGTTTDIAVVRGGTAAVARDGALVGGWKTQVRAADIWTVGLGGDSKIVVEAGGEIKVGPRRAIPLSFAASRQPDVLDKMRRAAEAPKNRGDLRFFTPVRRPHFALSRREESLFRALEASVLDEAGAREAVGDLETLERFVRLGIIAEIAFTPTDLLHALGALDLWDASVAAAAAQILAERMKLPVREALAKMLGEITALLTLHLTAKPLFGNARLARFSPEDHLGFLKAALGARGESALHLQPRLTLPLVAVGAPVRAFFPRAAEELGARLHIPEHAEVANAVGAVSGRVVERVDARIRPLGEDGFLASSPRGARRFERLEDAVAAAEEGLRELAVTRVLEKGGTDVEVHVERREQVAPLNGAWGDSALIELIISATAVGSPDLRSARQAPAVPASRAKEVRRHADKQSNAPLRIGVVACRMLQRELERELASFPEIVEVIWLEAALHVYPQKMKAEILERVDSLRHMVDVVFLGYGYCRSLKGIEADTDVPLVLPPHDDCLAILMTPERYEQEKRTEVGTWFMTPGWAEAGAEMVIKELRLDRVRTRGRDPMELARRLFTHYRRGLFVDTGVGDEDRHLELAGKFCEDFGLVLEKTALRSDILRTELERCRDAAVTRRTPVACCGPLLEAPAIGNHDETATTQGGTKL